MNIGKTLAITAATGMLAAFVGGCGGDAKADPKVPTTESAPAGKDCCKGKNECKTKSGCKAGENATCAGQNNCKSKGTSCPKPG